MAFAFWRILCLPGRTRGCGMAIAVFLPMLALSVLWPFRFFAALLNFEIWRLN